jgi:hypothetical protein
VVVDRRRLARPEFLLPRLDLLLPEQTKASIDRKHKKVWERLSEWKRMSISDWLFNRKYRLRFATLAVVAAICFFLYAAVGSYPEEHWTQLVSYALGIPVGAVIGWLFLNFVLRGRKSTAVMSILLTLLVMSISAGVIGWHWFHWEWWLVDGDVKGFDFVQLMFWEFAFSVQFTCAMFWWVSFVPLFFILVAEALLVAGELVFRRISNWKGGVLDGWSKIIEPF